MEFPDDESVRSDRRRTIPKYIQENVSIPTTDMIKNFKISEESDDDVSPDHLKQEIKLFNHQYGNREFSSPKEENCKKKLVFGTVKKKKDKKQWITPLKKIYKNSERKKRKWVLPKWIDSYVYNQTSAQSSVIISF